MKTSSHISRPARTIIKLLAGTALISALSGTAQAQSTSTPSMAEMWEMIQNQAKRIDQLETELAEAQVEQVETREEVENVIEAVETGIGGSSSASWADKTSVGGYGEFHYEGGDRDQIDFHRFVLFIGHEFNDSLRFFSELEVEHVLAGEGFGGAVELEQAFLEYDLNAQTKLRGGLQLIPVGILNEVHEPNTFFGVERNRIENQIIPTTFWEAAVGINGQVGETGFSYDALFHSGIELNAANGYRVRSGRRRAAEAPANSGALTGRVKYTGIPGIEFAATVNHQFDVTQGQGDEITGEKVAATLFSAHIDGRYQGFGLRALYAGWDIDGDQAELIGRDKQNGFYIEPSYRFDLPITLAGLESSELGLFYRYEDYDTSAGFNLDTTSRQRNVVGLSYWPYPDIVLKGDYYWEDRSDGTDDQRFNLGIGYQF